MGWVYIIGGVFVVLGASVFFGAPYVPSHRRDLRQLFDELRPLSEHDVVFDAGSGDGVVLREAARHGAKAIGYEINPVYWIASLLLSRKTKNVSIKLQNFWTSPFPDDMTVLYVFFVSRDGKKLEARLAKERARLARTFTVIAYGIPLPTVAPQRSFGAFHIYEF